MQFIGAFLLLVISILGVSIAANDEESVMSNEKTEVLNAIQAMTSAFQNKDIGGVLASYESGAAVMFEPGVRVSDSAMLQKMFEGAFQLNPDFNYPNGHEVYMANNLALHIAPWEMSGIAPDGMQVKQQGLSVAVLRKQDDGQWLLVLDNPHGQVLMKQ